MNLQIVRKLRDKTVERQNFEKLKKNLSEKMNLDHLEREIEDAEMLLSRDVYTRGLQHSQHNGRNDKENRVKDITEESKKLSKRERSVRFFFVREFTLQ